MSTIWKEKKYLLFLYGKYERFNSVPKKVKAVRRPFSHNDVPIPIFKTLPNLARSYVVDHRDDSSVNEYKTIF